MSCAKRNAYGARVMRRAPTCLSAGLGIPGLGMTSSRHALRWEEQAENWVLWARSTNHDAFWDYAPSFFSLLPPPHGWTLELGCGEGRVVRDLLHRGHRVGLELSQTLVRYAGEADATSCYVQGNASAFPFSDGSFELVVAYNSLMDIEDMPGAVVETARVLRSGGRLCVSVTHPLNDAGTFVTRGEDSPFVIEGSYLGKRDFEAKFERDGFEMTFSGWAYSFEEYFSAFETAGLLTECLREPPAPDQTVQQDPAERRWQRVPLFALIRALKL
jgi:SAM-dependent methyltransferase